MSCQQDWFRAKIPEFFLFFTHPGEILPKCEHLINFFWVVGENFWTNFECLFPGKCSQGTSHCTEQKNYTLWCSQHPFGWIHSCFMILVILQFFLSTTSSLSQVIQWNMFGEWQFMVHRSWITFILWHHHHHQVKLYKRLWLNIPAKQYVTLISLSCTWW